MHALFTARPARTRRLLPTVALVAFFTLWHTVGAMFGAAAATTATISGTAFQDLNRDGIKQAGESPFAGHVIYLFDANGQFVATRTTDTDGRYAFADQPAGTYEVTYMRTSWKEIWSDWVPTTTDWVFPEATVTLDDGSATVDFGWRPITWSADLAAPISEVVGDQGLVVQSYNDAVTAQQLHDEIVDNFRVGAEAPTARMRFGYGTYDRASTQIQQSDGAVTHVQTTAYVSYERLLSQGGFWTLAHEYGHVAMNYHNYLVHQDVDRTWSTYLEARGIDPDDARLGTSRRWMPEEIAAEDYRQLFTTGATSASRHMNPDLPDAWDVAGLEQWLTDVFMTPPATTPDGEGPDAGATDEPLDEPVVVEEPIVVEEPVAEEPVVVETPVLEDPAPALTVRPSKVKGVNRADLAWSSSGPTEVHRDGKQIAVVDGMSYTDGRIGRGSPTHTYRVCERATGVCTSPVEVKF